MGRGMSTSDHVLIEADKLTKLYGPNRAVDEISFTCHEGEIVGFLGPNGAGKTTTMRILTGYMPPTAGDAYIAGFHTVNQSMEARQHLGYLPETVPLYPEMTVEGYLAFMGQIRRVPDLWEKVDAVLQSVDLLDRAESLISSLSKGMRQRVGLAQALLHNPDVVILDEPTIGLDPAQIVEIRQLIRDLGSKHTVLLSTHILQEVEQICTRVIMVINGRIWADMPMTQIKNSGNLVNIKVANAKPDAATLLGQVPGVTAVAQPIPNEFSLTVDGRDATRMHIAETAVSNGWGLLELIQAKMSLETIFLNKVREAEAAGYRADTEEPETAETTHSQEEQPHA